MTFTTPPTFGASYQILSSDLNSYWTNDLVWLNTAHGCRVFKTGGAPTISNNTNTTVTFDSESEDTDAFHSTSSNTSRITIPTGLDGVYDFGCSIGWAANNTGYRQVLLLKNGTTTQAYDQRNAGSNGDQHTVSFLGYRAVATDYFEIQVKQTSGAGLALSTAASYNCQFSGWRRGA